MQFFPFLNTDDAPPAKGLTAPKALGRGVLSRLEAKATGSREQFAALLDNELAAFPDSVPGRGKAVQSMWDKARSGARALSADGMLEGGVMGLASKGRKAATAKTASKAAGQPALDLAALASGGGALSGIKELSELKMTREDLLALKDGLRAFGLTKGDTDALDERIASQAGLSWGQFMAALSGKMAAMGRSEAPAALTEAESREMRSLFQKLGFTAAKSRELLSTLQNGGTASVWEAIGSKLSSMPEGSTVSLDRSELATLGKVMKLSESGQTRLTSLLGEAGSADLDSKQLSTVMTMLRAEVRADKAIEADSNQALRNLVAKGLAEAADRAGLSMHAGNKPDNSVHNQKVLAQESRRERAGRDAAQGDVQEQGAAARILDADPNAAPTRRSALAGDGAGAEKREGHREGVLKDGESGRYLADTVRGGSSGKGENASNGKPEGDSADAAWKEMWNKVRVDSRARARTDETGQSGTRFGAMPGMTEMNSREALSGLDRDVAARALRQVESGIVKTMGQGQKQLVLRLDPAELGKLNIILSVKDGEVSATFRAESREGHHLLTEQLSQLKTHLEQQGIKVGKMEVQTQLQSDQNGNQWLGEGEHNQAREQENLAKRQDLLRLLRGQDQGVAQEMQIESRTARIAREGLDIIA